MGKSNAKSLTLMRVKIILLILFLVGIICIFYAIAADQVKSSNTDSRENILIIHSYNQGFSWTDELHHGIIEQLPDSQYNIYTEYLDAYRDNPLNQNKIETIKSYATKNIDYIVVTDNTAFDLILTLKKDFFPNTPVLFAGVNGGIPPNMAFDDVKGILQNIDYREFLLWLNATMPQIKDLLVCGADTATTKGTYAQIIKAYEDLNPINLNFTIHSITIDDYFEQTNEIKAYDKNATALYSAGSFGVLNHDQYTDMLSSNTNMPTFCGVSTSITNQVIGGFVISPHQHGAILGKEILELSAGRDITTLPIIEKPVEARIFNYYGMKAFNISVSDLPPNSKIINNPKNNYTLTYNQVILFITMILLLMVIISGLLIIIKIRRKANLSLSKANDDLYKNKIELEEKGEKLIESQIALTKNYDLLVAANEKISNLVNYNQAIGIYTEIRFIDLLKTNFALDKEITFFNITITNLNELTYSQGKEIYEAILKRIADFLNRIISANDLIGLAGNNDFLIATEGIYEVESDLVKEIIRFFEHPFVLDLITVIIKYKIGIAYYPSQSSSYTELLYHSRLAIMPEINNELSNVAVFKHTTIEKIIHENCIRTEIETAMEKQELMLYYQPKYGIDGVTMVGLEALIRWNHKDGTIKTPAYFIDVAEQSGQIINIGFYVIEQVCETIVKYDLITRKIPVAINLSGQHFASKDILYKLKDVIERYRIPQFLLEIEITETALIANKEFGAAILTELRNFGFTITLDDFGTGYSSISYIKCLPIDKIKIDQSFTRRLDDLKSRNLLKGIIQMAHELSFEVTVEGVETEAQYEIIKTFKPDELQGYLFKRPCPIEELFEKN
ncbi:GGDEF domain-containing phosphodiesterase [Acetobacterium woodii]|nr:GGDEF domain-containing phosphodiesterase [Acetobacterium woodii]